MRVWHVWDTAAHLYPDEQSHMLVVADSTPTAIGHWRDSLGVGLDECKPTAEVAEWQWESVPEPQVPDKAGVYWPTQRTEFGPAYLGYGIHMDDDPECEDCSEHVHRDDTVEVDGCTVCRWCAADSAGGGS